MCSFPLILSNGFVIGKASLGRGHKEDPTTIAQSPEERSRAASSHFTGHSRMVFAVSSPAVKGVMTILLLTAGRRYLRAWPSSISIIRQ